MLFKSVLVAPLMAAGLVSAAPKASDSPFQVQALRSGSKIHFSPLQASGTNIALQLPKQEASCDTKDTNAATFELGSDGSLFLYAKSNPRQQLYVDRSGMGQGRLGYTMGAQPAPKNAERAGWKIDKDGNLNFAGKGLIACPIKDSYVVFVDNGIANPAGNKNCVGFSARTTPVKNPNACLYKQ